MDMLNQTVKGLRELPNLIAAFGIHLYREIITVAHTPHRCRKRM